ncbi:MAG: hypothetical protein ABFC84_15700 [Veillonellales bacterium]
MKWKEQVVVFLVTGIIGIAANVIGYHQPLVDTAVGFAILLAITLLGILVTHVMPIKLPMVFWISLLAIFAASSLSPIAPVVTKFVGKVDFLALCTLVLAYAGLSIGKDLEMFKKMSWKIIVVALVVYTGTFVFATIIAQFMLHVEGVI